MSRIRINYFTLCVFSIVFIIQINIHSQTIISDGSASSPFSSIPSLSRDESSSLSDINCKLSIDQWITKGDFRMHGGKANAPNTWELTHPIDGNILEALFTVCPEKDSPYLFNISLGSGNIKKGTIRDTDWDGNGVVSDLSYSTSQGNTFISSLSVDYRVTDIKKPYGLDLTFTYDYLMISADYRDGVSVVVSYTPTSILTPVKWQIYDLVYSGLEIGIKGKSDILEKLSMEASLGYTPFLEAEYKGVRYPDNIPVPKEREYIIARGSALSYQLCLNYNLVNQFSVQFGYKYKAYHTKGKDQPGTPWAGDWEELDSDFKGCFFGAGIKF